MTTLSELLEERQRARQRAELLADDARRGAMEKTRGLSELTDKSRRLWLEQMRCTLEHRPFARSAELAEVDRRLAELKKDSAYIDAIEPKYKCGLCRDTGYRLKNGRIAMCDCLKREVFVRIFGAVDVLAIESDFGDFSTDLYSDDVAKTRARSAKRLAKAFVSEYPQNEHKNLLITGNAGLGKTLLLNCMAAALAKKVCVLYLSAFTMFSLFHKDRLGEFDMTEMIIYADMLIIDDLGAEPMTTNVTREYALRLIDERSRLSLPTVIATNLGYNFLKERYGERLASRLYSDEICTVVPLSGKDLRQKKRG